MSTGAAAEKPLICLGEALVDLICPEPVADHAAARSFEVHFGGALANVAVAARRAGAPVALASGCGDDDRGRLLRDDLAAAGVDLRFYGEVPGVPTAFAFAYLDHGGEPTFEIHGAGIDAAIASLAGREGEIAAAGAAIVFGSNTLVDERSRDVTAAICERARGLGVPLLFDPNLRPGRWPDARRGPRAVPPATCATRRPQVQSRRGALAPGRGTVTATAAAEALLRSRAGAGRRHRRDGPRRRRGACTASGRSRRPSRSSSPLGAGDAFMGALAAEAHVGRASTSPGRTRRWRRRSRRGRGLHPPRSIRAMSGGGERGYARGAGDAERVGRKPTSTGDGASRSREAGNDPRAGVSGRFATASGELYGSRRNDPHGDPIHELVLTILSQNTNDNNRDVAYRAAARPASAIGTRSATPRPTGVEAIRPGGLANMKGPRIQQVLRRLGDRDADLDWLAEVPARRGDRLPDGAAGRRAQDRGLRHDLRARPARDPGRHPRLPGRRPARAVPARDLIRGARTTRCSRSPTAPTPTSCT